MRWSLPNCFSASIGTMGKRNLSLKNPAQCSRSWALGARNTEYAVLPAQSLGQSHGVDSRVNCVQMTSSTATPFPVAGRHLRCQLANFHDIPPQVRGTLCAACSCRLPCAETSVLSWTTGLNLRCVAHASLAVLSTDITIPVSPPAGAQSRRTAGYLHQSQMFKKASNAVMVAHNI
jgi:hypothetical protein